MRRTRTDHSGVPKNRLPPVPERDLVLFHWSPTKNRRSVNRFGLDIGKTSLQGNWKPPYVCFGDDPHLAWRLSGQMWPEISSWDLWQFNFNEQTSNIKGYEIITDTYYITGRPFIKEYRIYYRIYKRDIEYLGTREQ